MSVYVIVDVDVKDAIGYEDYKKLASAAVELYGGSYVARGGKTEMLEGGWESQRIVILKFPSPEQAKAWLNSPEYAPARKLRHEFAYSRMIMVEGLE